MNIDRRRKYIIGLDTETCNGIMQENGKLDLSQSLVYDIGWQVTDKHGNVYVKRSFCIYEIFVDMKDAMKSAYYAKKIPMYWEQIQSGQRTLARFFTIWKIFKEDCENYNISAVFAHNASFDFRALNNTIRYITKSSKRFFFQYGLPIWDTLKMARQTYGKEKSYRRFCEKYGYMTNHEVPQVRLTAEILYRYITGDNDFIESHTGLEDVEIETQIFCAIMKKHRKIDKNLF